MTQKESKFGFTNENISEEKIWNSFIIPIIEFKSQNEIKQYYDRVESFFDFVAEGFFGEQEAKELNLLLEKVIFPDSPTTLQEKVMFFKQTKNNWVNIRKVYRRIMARLIKKGMIKRMYTVEEEKDDDASALQ